MMVLIAIVGGLGSGKTLTLTYLLSYNYIIRNRKIYSNYKLKSPVEYTKIGSLSDLDNMRSGVFGGDELWLWVDSRETKKSQNKFISMCLAKSRKRDIDIIYTTQALHQVEKRIRTITDFAIYPQLNYNETKCTLKWYSHPNTLYPILQKMSKFYTKPIFNLYDTREEIDDLI